MFYMCLMKKLCKRSMSATTWRILGL